MNKIISLKAQKIIVVIPFLNCLILFVWIYNYARMPADFKIFARSWLVIFASAIPLVIVQIILSKIQIQPETLSEVINLLFIYLVPFAVGIGLICYQKKVLLHLEGGK